MDEDEDDNGSDEVISIPGLPEIFRTEPGQEPRCELAGRQAYTLNSFREEYKFVEKPPYHFEIREYKPVISRKQMKNFLKSRIPILVWLKEYHWRKDILADIVGGITLGVLRIPQGMAYSLLANVDAVYGLYTCFFSCLVYTLLGSSHHVSVGSFSVLCLMMGVIVQKHYPSSKPDTRQPMVLEFSQRTGRTGGNGAEIRLLSAMCFVVGIMHLVLGLFQLGSLSIVMSETLVSGFTTGAACHVFTSQVPLLAGVTITETAWEYFSLFQVYIEVFKNIGDANYITGIISILALGLLIFTTNYDVGGFKRRTGLPLPMELIIVVIITLVSHFVKLHADYGVEIVGDIPQGLPEPSMPDFSIMPKIIVESIPIAIVSYVISYSMALIFAKKYNYRVHANQELFALGVCNIVCAFFASFPVSVALARTLVQDKAGCKTQLASFISCSLILAVLIFIGPLFYDLPTCILGAIVMAAVQGMFFQIRDLILAWKLSILDALVWLVSFISTVIAGTTKGLIVSVAFSLLTIILRTINIRAFKVQFTEPQACMLGAIPNTDIYVDILKYKAAKEVPGIKIFRFNGPIHFANRTYFKRRLHDLIDVTTKMAQESRNRRLTVHYKDRVEKRSRPSVFFSGIVRFIILDWSGCPYIDLSGLSILHEIIKDYEGEAVTVHLAACQDPVLDMLKHTKFESKALQSCIFPTIHDAVLYCIMARNALMPKF